MSTGGSPSHVFALSFNLKFSTAFFQPDGWVSALSFCMCVFLARLALLTTSIWAKKMWLMKTILLKGGASNHQRTWTV